jgi:hypothetical protein
MDEPRKRQLHFFLIDMAMLAILTINLVWIVLDALFGIAIIQNSLKAVSSQLVAIYLPVHRNFFIYDLAFIGIYVTEFLIQWALAVKRRTHHRWFFYPFIHWYDVIGCIPVNTFRFVRIFRVISILYRMQQLDWIDFRRTFVFKALAKYYDIFTEEISDRVVINVLTEMQAQIQQGSPVLDKIAGQVVKSRKPEMVKWFSRKMQHVAAENYGDIREDIRAYVDLRVREAVKHNRELTTIRRTVPVVGGIVIKNIEKIVADVVFQVINGIVEDLSDNNLEDLFDRIADILLGSLLARGEDRELNRAVTETVVQTIEIVKDQVRLQQWKLRENVLKEAGLES